MSLITVARVLGRPTSTVWQAVVALGIRPYQHGVNYWLTWHEIERIEAYLLARREKRTTSQYYS